RLSMEIEIARDIPTRLLILLLLPLAAQAGLGGVDKKFCISGASTGKGWQYTLEISTDGGVTYIAGVPDNEVPAGAGADALAKAWVDSLNSLHQHRDLPASFKAEVVAGQPNCFIVETVAPHAATLDFKLFVDTCEITNNPNGCSFNPVVF